MVKRLLPPIQLDGELIVLRRALHRCLLDGCFLGTIRSWDSRGAGSDGDGIRGHHLDAQQPQVRLQPHSFYFICMQRAELLARRSAL